MGLTYFPYPHPMAKPKQSPTMFFTPTKRNINVSTNNNLPPVFTFNNTYNKCQLNLTPRAKAFVQYPTSGQLLNYIGFTKIRFHSFIFSNVIILYNVDTCTYHEVWRFLRNYPHKYVLIKCRH